MNNGELKPGENHPSTQNATAWLYSLGGVKLRRYEAAICEVALTGDRTSEILSETIDRLLHIDKEVGEVYLLGLAWYIRNLEDAEE